jgi:predicted Zn-dependent peptidase
MSSQTSTDRTTPVKVEIDLTHCRAYFRDITPADVQAIIEALDDFVDTQSLESAQEQLLDAMMLLPDSDSYRAGQLMANKLYTFRQIHTLLELMKQIQFREPVAA